jgi:hypothetical protein
VIGEAGSSKDHSADPTSLWDIFCRAGGGYNGSCVCMVTINSNDVIGDHFWLWRADHGAGVGWDNNKNANGLIVNGNNVTIYGLFAEHSQGYETIWNGNGGRCYFYQNELPYDVPNQNSWQAGSTKGYAAYKVADKVTTHEAWALGSYPFFNRAPVVVENAFEVPANVPGITMHNLFVRGLDGNLGTIGHIINGKGDGMPPGSNALHWVESYP